MEDVEPSDFEHLSMAIVDRLPTLSAQLQTAAKFVLSRPDDVAMNSMRMVAGDAGVQPATMVRLAQAFGFEGYAAFRKRFQQRLRLHPSDFAGRAASVQRRGDDAAALVKDVWKTGLQNIDSTFNVVDMDKLTAFSQAVLAARSVYVLGLRSSQSPAFYFTYLYSLFRDNGTLLDGAGGTTLDPLRRFEKGDLLVAFGTDPYSAGTVAAVRLARRRGGTVCVITDSFAAPLVADADHVLITQNESPSFFQSIASTSLMVEALLAVMIRDGGRDALETLEAAQKQLAQFDAYWSHER